MDNKIYFKTLDVANGMTKYMKSKGVQDPSVLMDSLMRWLNEQDEELKFKFATLAPYTIARKCMEASNEQEMFDNVKDYVEQNGRDRIRVKRKLAEIILPEGKAVIKYDNVSYNQPYTLWINGEYKGKYAKYADCVANLYYTLTLIQNNDWVDED